jgi:hemerythrin
MLAEILQVAHRLQYGEALQLRPLLSQLHDGFLEHIEQVDQEYSPWLREHGIC